MALGGSIGKLFGKSPIKPIQQHMTKAHQCVESLRAFFETVIREDWDAAEATQQTIARLENEADDLKVEIRLNLPKSLFLPVPRQDLLELIHMQENIANGARDIAGLMLGRRMTLPPPITDKMLEFVDASLRTSAQALTAIQELDELLETGFSGPEVHFVENLITELNQLEHDSDVREVDIRAALFAVEAEYPPVDVVFLYRVIDGVGTLADSAQKVGSRLQLLTAR